MLFSRWYFMKDNNQPISPPRRRILKAMAASAAVPFLPACSALNSAPTESWLSAAGSSQKNYALAWASSQQNAQQLLSGFRGHGLTQHSSKPYQAIMLSRRPGNEGIVLNVNKQRTVMRFKSPDHLFMEGHGCFNQTGEILFCSESNRHTQQGVITVRDTQNYHLIKELSSGGIGPHEILLHPTQANTLVIANGGLIKNASGEIINGHIMDSNICFLNTQSGEITQRFYVQEKKASLRHMDISSDGIIAVAIQVQRSFTDHDKPVALTALIKDSQLMELQAPAALLNKMQDYVGSVRINNKYRTAAFTSPRGDMALFWNIDNGTFLGEHYFHNVCGVTVSSNEEFFVLSNSAGKLRHIHGSSLIEQRDLRQHHPDIQWDNHMLTLSRA